MLFFISQSIIHFLNMQRFARMSCVHCDHRAAARKQKRMHPFKVQTFQVQPPVNSDISKAHGDVPLTHPMHPHTHDGTELSSEALV